MKLFFLMKETLSIQPYRLIKTIKFILYTVEEGEKGETVQNQNETTHKQYTVCGLSGC